MRILTRYILREVTAHALIGAAIFTFVLFTRDLGHILELVVRASAPLPSVAEIFSFTVPLALTYTLPMSVLVGILIGLSRLAADSEITAMRASGMGVWSFLRSLSIFVFAAWFLALANGLYVAPRSQAALARLEDRLKGSQVSFEVQPRVFYEGFPKYVLYVQDVKSAEGAAIWKDVFMADLTDASNPKITLAKEGVITKAQARNHPLQNILLYCLGCLPLRVNQGRFEVRTNDLVLLCTDGLYHAVNEKKMISLLRPKISLQKKLEGLLQATLDSGGHDNITLAGLII